MTRPLLLLLPMATLIGCGIADLIADCEDNPSLPYCLVDACDDLSVQVDPIGAAAADGSLTVTGTISSTSGSDNQVRVAVEDATVDADTATWTVTLPADRLAGMVVDDDECASDTSDPDAAGLLTLPVLVRRHCEDRSWVEACSPEDGDCPSLCWQAPSAEEPGPEPEPEPSDGGTPDGGTPDGGTPDGGTPDGGTADGGAKAAP